MDMAKSVTFPLPLLGVAYQQLIHGMSKASLHVDLFASQWQTLTWNQRLEIIHPLLLSALAYLENWILCMLVFGSSTLLCTTYLQVLQQ